jgi:hypothetical protein
MAPSQAIDILTAAWAAEGRAPPVLLGLPPTEHLEFAARCGLSQEVFLAAFRVIVARAQCKALATWEHTPASGEQPTSRVKERNARSSAPPDALMAIQSLTAIPYKDIYPYMTPATKKHQQLILLEPAQAELLDELAADTRLPKQILLREAVDDLLSRYRKGVITLTYVRIRAALKEARLQLIAYRRNLMESGGDTASLQKCNRAIDRIDLAGTVVDVGTSGGKKMALVYHFDVWNHGAGENVRAPRMATMDAIKRANGVADISSEMPVDESSLDGNGFYPPKAR